MRRTSALTNIDTLVDREIGSEKYLEIIEVSKYLTQISTIVSNLTAILLSNDNITITAAVGNHITELLALEAQLTAIVDVYNSLTTITAVSPHTDNIDTVSTNIANVNAVAGDILDVQALALNLSTLEIIAGDLVNACVPSILDNGSITDTSIDPNCTSTSVIQSVAANIAEVLTVGNNIVDVVTVAINIANVNAVGASIANVNTVAADLVNIDSIATTVIPNMAEILLADDNAIIATTKAGEASVSAIAAVTSETNAANSELLANKWATEAVDVPVTPGFYSAYHWAQKANDYVTGALANGAAILIAVKATTDITIGQPLAFVSYDTIGNVVNVGLADHTTGVSIGLAYSSMLTGTTGFVLKDGLLINMDTSAFSSGDILFVSTAGSLTNVTPTSGYCQPIAFVLKSDVNGSVMVTVDYPIDTAVTIADLLTTTTENLTIDLGGIV